MGISTIGGGARDFTSPATWESATDNDLVTDQETEALEGYADSPDYDFTLSLSGATTNALYHRIFRPAIGHVPKVGIESGFRIVSSADSQIITVSEEHATLSDLWVRHNINSASSRIAILLNGVNTAGLVAGCVVFGSTNSGAGEVDGILVQSGTALPVIVDCLVYGTGMRRGIHTVQEARLYNNTCIGMSSANFNTSSASTIAKNCLGGGGNTDFSGTFSASSSHNASVDDRAPGTSSRINQTFVFLNEAAHDYHLAEDDQGALGFGADLSADANFPFNDDIDGQIITLWSIGADAQMTPSQVVDPRIRQLIRYRQLWGGRCI